MKCQFHMIGILCVNRLIPRLPHIVRLLASSVSFIPSSKHQQNQKSTTSTQKPTEPKRRSQNQSYRESKTSVRDVRRLRGGVDGPSKAVVSKPRNARLIVQPSSYYRDWTLRCTSLLHANPPTTFARQTAQQLPCGQQTNKQQNGTSVHGKKNQNDKVW